MRAVFAMFCQSSNERTALLLLYHSQFQLRPQRGDPGAGTAGHLDQNALHASVLVNQRSLRGDLSFDFAGSTRTPCGPHACPVISRRGIRLVELTEKHDREECSFPRYVTISSPSDGQLMDVPR